MGLRILYDPILDAAVMYCSTTDWAFGPLITADTTDEGAVENAQLFIDWLPQDARRYTDADLERLYWEWHSKKDALLIEKRRAEAELEKEWLDDSEARNNVDYPGEKD